MSGTIYAAVPLMLFLAILQSAALPQFPILGFVPQFPLLFALAWGLRRGVNEGVLWAFIAGICFDLFSAGPLGLSAVAFIAAVLSATWLGGLLPPNRFFLPLVLAGLASLIASFLSLILLQITGYPMTAQALSPLPAAALLHAVLMMPIYWLVYAVERTISPPRVKI